jgi:hypothetical protein
MPRRMGVRHITDAVDGVEALDKATHSASFDHDTLFPFLLALGGPLIACLGYWVVARFRR